MGFGCGLGPHIEDGDEPSSAARTAVFTPVPTGLHPVDSP